MTRRDLPEDVLVAFDNLATLQRGRPERAMSRVQRAIGGGVLSWAVEHTGDLTHRMADRWHVTDLDAGVEYVDTKVRDVLRTMRNAYGFAREHNENVTHNASYSDIPLRDYQRKVYLALMDYADEHQKLPVFNLPQFHAREAAVALGRQTFERAEAHLSELEKLLDQGDEAFAEAASQYRRGPSGKILEIKKGRP